MKHNGDSDAPVSEVIAGAGRLAVSLAEEVVLLRRIVQDQAALITFGGWLGLWPSESAKANN